MSCEKNRLDLTAANPELGVWAECRVSGVEDPLKEAKVVPIQAIQRSTLKSEEPLTITEKLVLRDKTVVTHLPSFELHAANLPAQVPATDSLLATCDAGTLAQCMASATRSINRAERLGSKLAESVRLLSDGKRLRTESTDSVRYGCVYVGGQVETAGELVAASKTIVAMVKTLVGLVRVGRSDNQIHFDQQDGLVSILVSQLNTTYPDTDKLLSAVGKQLCLAEADTLLQALSLMGAISGRDRDLQLVCDGQQLHMSVVDVLDRAPTTYADTTAKAETVVAVSKTHSPWKLKVRLSDLTLATSALSDMGVSTLKIESVWEGGVVRLSEDGGNGSCQMFGTLEV